LIDATMYDFGPIRNELDARMKPLRDQDLIRAIRDAASDLLQAD
jgi:hypothetical protein